LHKALYVSKLGHVKQERNEKMKKQINKVTKKECMDAIDYLFTNGFTLEMTTDKRYYTEILLKKVANVYNIELKGIDNGK